MKLADLVPEAAMPLYGIRPRHWPGPAFVGDTERIAKGLVVVKLVYVDDELAPPRAAMVSNLAPQSALDDPWLDPIDEHVATFVARFDPAFVSKRTRRRRPTRFPLNEFATHDLVSPVAGRQVGARLHAHRTLPLRFVRVALQLGSLVTDVAVAGWNTDPRDLAALVEPVDVPFAAEFDAASDPVMPAE